MSILAPGDGAVWFTPLSGNRRAEALASVLIWFASRTVPLLVRRQV
jgi:hypothetical protein